MPRVLPLRQRVRKLLLPDYVYQPLRLELGLLPVRVRSARIRSRYRGERGLLVNIGCGRRALSGFINVDAGHMPGIDCVWDCRTSLPFDDGSVLGIFSEHFFEHLHYEEEVPRFLRECHRVLQPSGVLRLVVPDAGRYVHAYSAGGWDGVSALRGLDSAHVDPWFGTAYETPMELLNAIFRQGGDHKFAYDSETLARVLSRHGLRPTPSRFGQSSLQVLAADSPDRASESLYFDAER